MKAFAIIFPLILYIDFKPSYDFRDDVSAFFIFRIEDGKKEFPKFKLNNMVFNILSLEL